MTVLIVSMTCEPVLTSMWIDVAQNSNSRNLRGICCLLQIIFWFATGKTMGLKGPMFQQRSFASIRNSITWICRAQTFMKVGGRRTIDGAFARSNLRFLLRGGVAKPPMLMYLHNYGTYKQEPEMSNVQCPIPVTW